MTDLEWPAALDLDALLLAGFRPHPFHQFVLKLAGRCDLACDYCYVYEMADRGWRDKPARMSRVTIDHAVRRIAEHVTAHGVAAPTVVLHGGEPLLAGADMIGYVAGELRRTLPEPDLRIQTNGVRLTDDVLDVLAAHRVRVGVSLDGAAEHHDRHRRRVDDRGSFVAVAAGLRRLTTRHPDLFAGLLCTIDLRNDPVAVYEALLDFRPPAVDLLLPHGNWTTPPPGLDPAGSDTPYGDWLVRVFDRWYDAKPRETGVRIFEELIHLLLGGASRTETIGLSPVAVVVIDTDGALEQVDTLRSAYDGASGTGLAVDVDDLDRALRHPGVLARQIGVEALSAVCRGCGLHRICGGGYYPHRYRAGAGFRQPSVYCRDLARLIRHAHRRLHADLTAAAAAREAAARAGVR
jgi:uncharacterized protein